MAIYEFTDETRERITKREEVTEVREEWFSLDDLRRQLVLAKEAVLDAQTNVAAVEAEIAEIEATLSITIEESKKV